MRGKSCGSIVKLWVMKRGDRSSAGWLVWDPDATQVAYHCRGPASPSQSGLVFQPIRALAFQDQANFPGKRRGDEVSSPRKRSLEHESHLAGRTRSRPPTPPRDIRFRVAFPSPMSLATSCSTFAVPRPPRNRSPFRSCGIDLSTSPNLPRLPLAYQVQVCNHAATGNVTYSQTTRYKIQSHQNGAPDGEEP
ncbi:hypothetical protein Pan216_26150 [Planctomycetes bacterium Pan216]|uniref:Uncharacterized protein n=1 Tax=Kolteria novifilia TaxID=2527975 RepID=A0A518B434_9BACT|nr:hypothetical protein Pan216_26150 [Planctomycetes bacterium Pan216]